MITDVNEYSVVLYRDDLLQEEQNDSLECHDTLSENAECDIKEYEQYSRLEAKEMEKEMTGVGEQMTIYLQEIATYPVLSDAEIFELSKKAKKGDCDARDRIFLHNLRLVVFVAKKYMKRTTKFSPLDLIMEGNLGLYKAIDRFDPALGFTFATYAYSWIRQAITRALMKDGTTIRIPVHMHEQLAKYHRCINSYKQHSGRSELPPKEMVKKELGINDEQYLRLITAHESYSVDSLNRHVTSETDDDTELMEFIPDTETDFSLSIINDELADTFDKLIDRFFSKNHTSSANRNKDILYRRFGFHGYPVHTLGQAGDVYGITRERVRQIESRFIKFCRTGKARSELAKFLD